jgi:hypothetical protein
MKVKLMSGIESMHGKIGNMCFRTLKSGQVIMCRMPRKRVVRKASDAQKTQRERFSLVVKKVNEMMQDSNQRGLMEVLYKQYGHKNETLRGFVFRQVNKMLAQ